MLFEEDHAVFGHSLAHLSILPAQLYERLLILKERRRDDVGLVLKVALFEVGGNEGPAEEACGEFAVVFVVVRRDPLHKLLVFRIAALRDCEGEDVRVEDAFDVLGEAVGGEVALLFGDGAVEVAEGFNILSILATLRIKCRPRLTPILPRPTPPSLPLLTLTLPSSDTLSLAAPAAAIPALPLPLH